MTVPATQTATDRSVAETASTNTRTGSSSGLDLLERHGTGHLTPQYPYVLDSRSSNLALPCAGPATQNTNTGLDVTSINAGYGLFEDCYNRLTLPSTRHSFQSPQNTSPNPEASLATLPPSGEFDDNASTSSTRYSDVDCSLNAESSRLSSSTLSQALANARKFDQSEVSSHPNTSGFQIPGEQVKIPDIRSSKSTPWRSSRPPPATLSSIPSAAISSPQSISASDKESYADRTVIKMRRRNAMSTESAREESSGRLSQLKSSSKIDSAFTLPNLSESTADTGDGTRNTRDFLAERPPEELGYDYHANSRNFQVRHRAPRRVRFRHEPALERDDCAEVSTSIDDIAQQRGTATFNDVPLYGPATPSTVFTRRPDPSGVLSSGSKRRIEQRRKFPNGDHQASTDPSSSWVPSNQTVNGIHQYGPGYGHGAILPHMPPLVGLVPPPPPGAAAPEPLQIPSTIGPSHVGPSSYASSMTRCPSPHASAPRSTWPYNTTTTPPLEPLQTPSLFDPSDYTPRPSRLSAQGLLMEPTPQPRHTTRPISETISEAQAQMERISFSALLRGFRERSPAEFRRLMEDIQSWAGDGTGVWGEPPPPYEGRDD